MLDLNNLYWEEKQNIDLIKSTAQQIWDSNVQFGEIKVINSPYPEFEWDIILYNKFSVLMKYDRSILDISVKTNGDEKWLTDLTDEDIVEGFESCKPENLLHNFHVLDRFLRKNMS